MSRSLPPHSFVGTLSEIWLVTPFPWACELCCVCFLSELADTGLCPPKLASQSALTGTLEERAVTAGPVTALSVVWP